MHSVPVWHENGYSGLRNHGQFRDPYALGPCLGRRDRFSILLHVQVRKIIWKLFELMPTPEAGMHADEATVRELIQPLGLAPKRAPMLIRFCRDYVEKEVCSISQSCIWPLAAP